jgi:hypothetical protein
MCEIKTFSGGYAPGFPKKLKIGRGREDRCTGKRKGDGGREGWDGKGREGERKSVGLKAYFKLN